jgi:hypothetical protein
MTNEEIARVISNEFVPVCDETVRKIRLKPGFSSPPPVHTFSLTDLQKHNRLEFARREVENPRD